MKFFSLLSLSILGFVSAQEVVTSCKPGYVALTFDDGPYKFTNELLDLLESESVKATFFVNGNNFWEINSQAAQDTIKRAYSSEHQIASHSWSHKDMNIISQDELESEIVTLEDALEGLIGKKPAYLRPPYGSYNNDVLQTLESHGYTTVTWNIDTKDYETHDITEERSHYRGPISSGNIDKGYIVLSHDVFQQTVSELAKDLIQYARAQGFKFTTVAECVGKPAYKN